MLLQLRTGATFSPCMRYIAAGSQDQSVLLWDLRSSGGGLLQRTRVAGSQGVADVAWHPLVPQLALGCMDGSVRFCSAGGAGV
jgi:WD40 repeat protein